MSASQAGSSRAAQAYPAGFESWRRRCESAVTAQPDIRAPAASCSPCQRANRTLFSTERVFPIRSLNDTYNDPRQQKVKSSSWGWFGRGDKTGSAATPDKSADERSVLDEIRLHLVDSQEAETPKDQGQREMCEKYLHNLLRTSPMVQFMVRNLTLVGCSPLDDDRQVSRIMFGKCPQTMAGGFAPSQKGQDVKQSGLLICYNGIVDKKHMEATLAHEMMHWFDHCRFKVDWSNWRHIACSEIRAASLSGDCRFWREVINRGQVGMLKQHQKCVRRRATDSLFMSEYGPKEREKAEQVVDEVWASCFNDTRPFDEIY